jgi:hypothetical protein
MSAIGTVKLMSVVPSVEVFCTIMSTFTFAAASGSNSAAEMPGRSGTPSTVTLASLMSVTTPEMIGIFHGGLLDGDPRAGLPGEAGAHVERDVVVAGELDRAQREHLRAGAGHLEHLVEVDLGSLRAWGTMRGSAENTPVTSV